MAQFYFKYGAMNSGKTIEILKVAHNYEEQGKKVLLFTSALDTRAGQGMIASRIGLERKAKIIGNDTDVFADVKRIQEEQGTIHCVLVDEAQFLEKKHVYQLAQIVDELEIPVMAFGLKNDFRNEMFEGTKHLLLQADKIEEIKTICWFCEHKATMNLHYIDGKPVYDGEQIQIGGNEAYYPVCRKHYHHPKPIEKKEDK